MSVMPHEIMQFLGDRVLGVSDAGIPPITGPAPLSPGAVGRLSFASRPDEATARALSSTLSSLLLVTPGSLNQAPSGAFVLAVADPRLEFTRACQRFFATLSEPGIHPTAVIDDTAELAPSVSVAAGVVIGPGVRIGERASLGANCIIGAGCTLGDDIAVGPGTVIGYAGFGYARDVDGTPVLMPHFGAVRIGNRVEIGANAAIDRGTMDDTVIEDDVKIDNLVHIAHNCHVREGALVIASSVLCGGVAVEPGAWISPNAVVKEQLVVGAQAIIGLSATVLRDVPPNAVVVGNPARLLPSTRE